MWQEEGSGGFYKCAFKGCCFATPLPADFERHLSSSHPREVTYVCCHCGAKLPSAAGLLLHFDDHLGGTSCSYACLQSCTFHSRSIQEVIDHMVLAHPVIRNAICWGCGERFEVLQSFLAHIMDNTLLITHCPYCPAKDTQEHRMFQHMASAHPLKAHSVRSHKLLVCNERKMYGWNSERRFAKLSAQPVEVSSTEDSRNRSGVSSAKPSTEMKNGAAPCRPNLTGPATDAGRSRSTRTATASRLSTEPVKSAKGLEVPSSARASGSKGASVLKQPRSGGGNRVSSAASPPPKTSCGPTSSSGASAPTSSGPVTNPGSTTTSPGSTTTSPGSTTTSPGVLSKVVRKARRQQPADQHSAHASDKTELKVSSSSLSTSTTKSPAASSNVTPRSSLKPPGEDQSTQPATTPPKTLLKPKVASKGSVQQRTKQDDLSGASPKTASVEDKGIARKGTSPKRAAGTSQTALKTTAKKAKKTAPETEPHVAGGSNRSVKENFTEEEAGNWTCKHCAETFDWKGLSARQMKNKQSDHMYFNHRQHAKEHS